MCPCVFVWIHTPTDTFHLKTCVYHITQLMYLFSVPSYTTQLRLQATGYGILAGHRWTYTYKNMCKKWYSRPYNNEKQIPSFT